MVTQARQPISIKGIRDGLLITLGEGHFSDLLHQLSEEMTQKQDFLQGSRIALAVGRRPLRYEQLAEVQDLFARHRLLLWTVLAESESTKAAARELGLATRLSGSRTDLEGKKLKKSKRKTPTTPLTGGEPPAASGPLFLKETLRSGRSIYHEGAVIIIGDVNPGAEVIAAGDVIVWGRLRGLVHAGALGDETAVICALELSPTQLRIADQIAIPPSERQRKTEPEQAAIRAGRIVAEPWQSRS